MTTKYDAVYFVITGTCKTYKKGYCFPSQEHIVHLARKFHKVIMSRRTLNRILKRMEQEGIFKRIRRHSKNSAGQLILRSTLYKLLGKVRDMAIRKLHWACGMLGITAVPKVAQHNSIRERMITYGLPPDVEIVWNPDEKGRASPVQGIL